VLLTNPLTGLRLVTSELGIHPGERLLRTAAGSTVGNVVLQLKRYLGFKTTDLARRRPAVEEILEPGGTEVICTQDDDLGSAPRSRRTSSPSSPAGSSGSPRELEQFAKPSIWPRHRPTSQREILDVITPARPVRGAGVRVNPRQHTGDHANASVPLQERKEERGHEADALPEWMRGGRPGAHPSPRLLFPGSACASSCAPSAARNFGED
jgi:hypothetical protein